MPRRNVFAGACQRIEPVLLAVPVQGDRSAIERLEPLGGRCRTAPSVSEWGSATGVTMRSSAERVAAWIIGVSLRGS
jgi:hypothetical protein